MTMSYEYELVTSSAPVRALDDAAVEPLLRRLIAAGERDPSKLANEAFFALHPARGRRPIAPGEGALARQWTQLRAGIVARLLARAPAVADSSVPGTTHYLTIDLGHAGTAAPVTGVYVPPGFRASAELDVIVFLHGHKTGYANGSKMAVDRYWAPSTAPRAPLREAVDASGKNVVLVVPTLGLRSQLGGLQRSGALDAYLERVSQQLADLSPWRGTTPRLRHLVLAAHSGGGIGMLSLVGLGDRAVRDNLRECWGYDCFYNPGADLKGWPAWAKANPNKTLFAYYATQAVSKAGTPLGPTSTAKSLERLRIANLRMLPSKRRDHFAPLSLHVTERISGAAFLAAR